jgi:5-methylcytosine-specific restriction endonuclease McrA
MSKVADPWYMSKEWLAVRAVVLKRDKFRCNRCGVLCLGKKKGKPSPHCDHIQPRNKRPDLALTPANIQTLCHSCHSKKSVDDREAHKKPLIDAQGYVVEEPSVVQA